MHVLLTNDDGIDAPGLVALESALGDAAQVTIVAPSQGYSGCGHQVTSHRPIQVERLEERRFKVFGTPADCTRLGLMQLAGSVDLVLAGVNDGGNLGVDVYMSGTVAAVREATWMGIPGIAFSQYARRERPRDWAKTARMARRALEEIRSRRIPNKAFWNVNLPDVDTSVEELPMVDTFVEPEHLSVGFEKTELAGFTFRGDYRNRPCTVGSDVEVCFGGGIAISAIPANP